MRGIAVCCGFNNYEVESLVRAENDAAILYTTLAESGAFNEAPDLIGRGGVFAQRTSTTEILAALTRAALSTADLVVLVLGFTIVSSEGADQGAGDADRSYSTPLDSYSPSVFGGPTRRPRSAASLSPRPCCGQYGRVANPRPDAGRGKCLQEAAASIGSRGSGVRAGPYGAAGENRPWIVELPPVTAVALYSSTEAAWGSISVPANARGGSAASLVGYEEVTCRITWQILVTNCL